MYMNSYRYRCRYIGVAMPIKMYIHICSWGKQTIDAKLKSSSKRTTNSKGPPLTTAVVLGN